jgi:hypothetical protein
MATTSEWKNEDMPVPSFKTSLCKFWNVEAVFSNCHRGRDCPYAHGESERQNYIALRRAQNGQRAWTNFGTAVTYEGMSAAEVVTDARCHQQAVPIGGGWMRFWDQAEGAHYYHNPETGETRWETPDKEGAVPASQSIEPASGEAEGPRELCGLASTDLSNSVADAKVLAEHGGQEAEGNGSATEEVKEAHTSANIAASTSAATGDTARSRDNRNVGLGKRSQNKAAWQELWGGSAYPPTAWETAGDGSAGVASAFAAAAAKATSLKYIDPELDALPPASDTPTPAAPGMANGQGSYAYHDGYDWDKYARVYRLPSGYHAYWNYYWGAGAGSAEGSGPSDPSQSTAHTHATYPNPPTPALETAAPDAATYAATYPAYMAYTTHTSAYAAAYPAAADGGGGGALIYQPGSNASYGTSHAPVGAALIYMTHTHTHTHKHTC